MSKRSNPQAASDKVAADGGTAAGESTAGLRVLKKYPNRRLYDTQSSSYITLGDVRQMVMKGEPFEVRDAKTADDLTRSILLQIILEEEAGGFPMFSTPMLFMLIRFYGHAMQGMMGSYLEHNLRQFMELQNQPGVGMPNLWNAYLEQSRSTLGSLQEQWQEQWRKASAGLFPGFPPKA